jgi:type I restriction enzyme R subunit
MGMNEAETRSQLINPAIQNRGWSYPLVREEVTAKKVIIEDDGTATRMQTGKADYVLQVQVNRDTEPVPVAVLEAKAEDYPPDHGLEQARAYADSRRLNVPLVIASNGHQFVLLNAHRGTTDAPAGMAEFPTPADLRRLYEEAVGFPLDAPEARPLLQPYKSDAGDPRYYQDAAIRAVMERIARCRRDGREARALLSLATGAGKTFIACNLLRRIADATQAGETFRALFVCDRTELRTQAMAAMHRLFGSDAAAVEEDAHGHNRAANARVHIATFQTLDVDREEGSASFLAATTRPTTSPTSSSTNATARRGASGRRCSSATPRRSRSASPPPPASSRSKRPPPGPPRTAASPPTTSATSASRSTSTPWPGRWTTASSPPARCSPPTSTSTARD